MSRLLSLVNTVRELIMGPLAVGVIILLTWLLVFRPMMALLPLFALVVLFALIVKIGMR